MTSQREKQIYQIGKFSTMAEEVKKTSPGDSVEGIETVEGDPNQKEAQDAQGIEGK